MKRRTVFETVCATIPFLPFLLLRSVSKPVLQENEIFLDLELSKNIIGNMMIDEE